MGHYFLWESNASWENLVIMAVIAVIFFQSPKKFFFDVLQHTNIMRYSLHFFVAFYLLKGVIGVPVAMAPIFFFVLEHGVTRIFKKQVIYVIITSFATSGTHIYPIEGCYW